MTDMPNPTRSKGWEIALAKVIEHHAQTPHAWGRSDCLHLGADAVLALTGSDPLAGVRGSYSSGAGAARMLKAAGFADIGEAWASVLEEGAPAMARRGDIGLIETVQRGNPVLATVVVMGAEVVGKSSPGRDGATGLTILSRNRLVRSFRVGW